MPNHNLPVQLTSLLGRDRETTSLRQLLSRREIRLVTITGPGGVGKTSLALHTVRQLNDAFHDGVVFISLAPIGDPTLVAEVCALSICGRGAKRSRRVLPRSAQIRS